ncbi:pyridoxamine 5'-phosphate oxidase [Pseudohongiella sp. SYSU M77423]|uniref:pyridoxamine 5'-phosphate oxidase n=1 Tax=Pseudohongiella sp. SYSU M77423 TaxID=3042312 RepID=UPI000C63BCA7|nr:pyridoxamine 5'-phosphate oxidase [Pseudohongiella sp. SYSU M77423]MAO40117.1 pyridoxamine 5'-phosphate oxidase [Pseudohongiella sp.]MAY55561.1 pyridoxamine 5'-phosphate oxidase [Gammaproteobacteria bacterium]MBJ54427.1 pyridoxamine 5'-phosphate oxidase [Gammaproteobacteria bacterium]MDH7942629.1 pyridoxamine 5'-phosphate oxidase [Pseudohongiella sp. SYSU M77423]HBN14501.1 pyridoxamine 5'-phosphate oxidase [Pseudohongiella sp.]|tara:strand:+ start:535 stop:1173 length:639 start_codon:yes stop_codon:yes gene_type:complete
MDLQSIRREYLRGSLTREDLLDDPIKQFQRWMEEAIRMEQTEPTAMVVATTPRDGQPSQRVVLLKGVDERGFTFFTNYESRKAREIAVNSRVSLHFPWLSIERQVIIGGVAEKVSVEESRAYFSSRPRESQLGAWASPQSRVLESRESMLAQFDSISKKFKDGDIPLPEFWGGFRVRPCQIEFWQGGARRLHDRFVYTLQAGGDWNIERLAP